jgi:hypothetical protein
MCRSDGAWSLAVFAPALRFCKNASVNPPMHHDASVIVTAMDASGAVTPDTARSIDAARANDCVRVLSDESSENAFSQQSGKEKLH